MAAKAVPQFKRSRRGVVSLTLDEVDARILRHVLTEMLELLGADEETPSEDDPLAVALGIGTSTSAPEDTALARLFPDAYRDDPEAAGDFRRYTEPGLRDGKRAAARTALATIGEPGDSRALRDEEADAWLRALNDARLVLGERLGVTEDWDQLVESLDEDDPRLPGFFVYERLTFLQELLVRTLS